MSVAAESDLLHAVLANPNDDGPRLVYADYLEEHGNPLRAEFIRVDVEIGTRPSEERFVVLVRRRSELILEMDDRGIEWTWRDHWQEDFIASIVRRGFVDEIELRLEHFIQFAEDAFRRFPITKVKLGDREPHPPTTRHTLFFWDRMADAGPERIDAPHLLPPELLYVDVHPRAKSTRTFVIMSDTPAVAYEWLSRACVMVGRRLAELEPADIFPVPESVFPEYPCGR